MKKKANSAHTSKLTKWLTIIALIIVLIFVGIEVYLIVTDALQEDKTLVEEHSQGTDARDPSRPTNDPARDQALPGNDPARDPGTSDLKPLPKEAISANTIKRIEAGYPAKKTFDGQLLTYKGFHLQYAEEHEQAHWVAYILTRDMVELRATARQDNFKADPAVTTGSATPSDYRASGYDRGHLAPAADMLWSEQAMQESFFMTNMSPQDPAFNRGIWKMLEEQTRNWAVAFDSLYVITGPDLRHILKSIGKENVSVPEFYFKVIFDMKGPEYKAIGFYMRNEGSKEPLVSFAMSVRELEQKTGIDFFSALPDDFENWLENTFNPADWGL